MKRIIRVSRLCLSAVQNDDGTPAVWYQLPVTRGQLYIMEDIEELRFIRAHPMLTPELIRVETTNLIYVKV